MLQTLSLGLDRGHCSQHPRAAAACRARPTTRNALDTAKVKLKALVAPPFRAALIDFLGGSSSRSCAMPSSSMTSSCPICR